MMNWFGFDAIPVGFDWPGESILAGVALAVVLCLGNVVLQAVLVSGGTGRRRSPRMPVLVRPRAMGSSVFGVGTRP